jgi:maltose O-acetyltransferase
MRSATQASGRRDVLELLARLGVDAEVLPPFQCDYGFTTMIGDRTFINYGVVILDCAR